MRIFIFFIIIHITNLNLLYSRIDPLRCIVGTVQDFYSISGNKHSGKVSRVTANVIYFEDGTRLSRARIFQPGAFIAFKSITGNDFSAVFETFVAKGDSFKGRVFNQDTIILRDVRHNGVVKGSGGLKTISYDKIDVQTIRTLYIGQTGWIIRNGVEVQARIADVDESGRVIIHFDVKDTGKTMRGIVEVDAFKTRSAKKYIPDGAPSLSYEEGRAFRKNFQIAGEDVLVTHYSTFSDIAKAEGKIIDGLDPSRLSKTKSYTYVVTKEGAVRLGEVDNALEIGVKHINIAGTDEVVGAGELSYSHVRGRWMWNTESGNVTRILIEEHGADPAQIHSMMENIFKHFLGDNIEYTPNILLPKAPPSLDYIRTICKHFMFCLMNTQACGLAGAKCVTPK